MCFGNPGERSDRAGAVDLDICTQERFGNCRCGGGDSPGMVSPGGRALEPHGEDLLPWVRPLWRKVRKERGQAGTCRVTEGQRFQKGVASSAQVQEHA